MNPKALTTLEYDKIIARLAALCAFPASRDILSASICAHLRLSAAISVPPLCPLTDWPLSTPHCPRYTIPVIPKALTSLERPSF